MSIHPLEPLTAHDGIGRPRIVNRIVKAHDIAKEPDRCMIWRHKVAICNDLPPTILG
jgi:hypothetical protein